MRTRRRGIFYVCAGLAWLAAACSLIVDGQVGEFKCSGIEPSACPSGMICNAAKSKCVQPGFRDPNDPGPIPPGQEDIDGQVSGPAGLGIPCVFDRECLPGLVCGSSTMLTTEVVPAGSSSICTKPCCTSKECGDNYVCFAPGTGGNYCIAAEKAQRMVAFENGKTGGEPCGAPEECRSGLCTDGVCNDTCCTQKDCAVGSTCRASNISGHVGWTCALDKDAGKELNEPCTSPDECQNENCVAVDSPSSKGCVPSCCSASDCDTQGFPNAACVYGNSGLDNLKWCLKTQLNGPLDAGARCNDDKDCRTRVCDAEQGVCVTACCSDNDCAPGEACKPSLVATPRLRCVPR